MNSYVKGHAIVLLFLAFFLFLILFHTTLLYDGYHAPKNLLLVFLGGVALPLYWLATLKRTDQVQIGVFGIIILLRGAYLIVTAPDEIDFQFSMLIYLALFSVYLFVQNISVDQQDHFVLALAVTLLISSTLLGGLGIYQFIAHDIVPGKAIKTLVIGSFGSPNAFGNWLALGFFAGLYLYRKDENRPIKIILIFFLWVIFCTLLLTESRGAILSFSIALAVWYLIKTQRKKRWFFLSIILIVCLFLFLFFLNKESSIGRVNIWNISLEMFIDHPLFGVGIRNFGNEFMIYQGEYLHTHSNILDSKAAFVRSAHNEYLQAFVEGGLIGGGLFAILILMVVYAAIKNRKKDYSLLAGVFLSIILAHSFVDSILHFTPQLVLLYMLIGLFDSNRFSFKGKFKIGVIGLFIPVLLFSVLVLFNQTKGRHFWAQGNYYTKLEAFHIAESYFEQGLTYLPNEGELLFHYGAVLAVNKNPERGIYFLKRASKSFLDKNLFLALSNAYLENNKPEIAISYADSVLYFFPDLLAPSLIKGEAYYRLENYVKSKKELLRCINQETGIKSGDTFQISQEAQELWESFNY